MVRVAAGVGFRVSAAVGAWVRQRSELREGAEKLGDLPGLLPQVKGSEVGWVGQALKKVVGGVGGGVAFRAEVGDGGVNAKLE